MLRIPTAALAIILIGGCGGGGGSAGSPPAAPVTSVTISGRVTFDKVPFGAGSDMGLDFARAAPAPVRGATVEILAGSGGTVLATGVTDAAGNYSLSVPPNTDVFVRVRAEMLRTGTPAWNFTVRDNTSFDSLYALDGSVFNTGSSAVTRNLHAASGWGGSSYTAARSAAPFSVLDAVYQALQLVLGASPGQVFPELRMMWSPNNRPVTPTGNVAAQRASGNIGTTFYDAGTPARIYVLGDAGTDTDEFDQHVVAHEWGHYYQHQFSRDDSIGGSHDVNQRLDYRVAFSEAWGNAFSGLAKGDPLYRDSFTMSGALRGFSINVDNNTSLIPGAFNEGAVQSVLYDLVDSANDGADTVSLGFSPIHAVMTTRMRTTNSLTTIYPFLSALRAGNPAQASAIDALAADQQLSSVTDDFGANEFNSGGDARNLPVFRSVSSGEIVPVCSVAANGAYNRLGNRKFLRFDLAAPGTITVRATSGPAGSDPDLALYSAGQQRGLAEGTAASAETLTVSGLGAGTYVIEVYEYSNLGSAPRGDTCFDLQVSSS